MKKYNSDEIESITVSLSKEKTPIAWENKVQCLMKSGLSREEAEVEATCDIELEIYYEIEYGLFAVESGAVESTSIISPYSGNELEESDEY